MNISTTLILMGLIPLLILGVRRKHWLLFAAVACLLAYNVLDKVLPERLFLLADIWVLPSFLLLVVHVLRERRLRKTIQQDS